MNPHDIDRLLRESPPKPAPAPGLHTRIRSAVEAAPDPGSGRTKWPIGLAAAAIVAINAAIIGHVVTRPAHPAIADLPPPAKDEQPDPKPIVSNNDPNPLRSEARAIGRDAGRAGRFLLDCLPSMAERRLP